MAFSFFVGLYGKRKTVSEHSETVFQMWNDTWPQALSLARNASN